MKANAIHGNTLAKEATWKKYTFTKKLSVMRSTAGLASYMTNPQVRESFISQSNCMKQEWNTWYTTYSQTTGVTVPGGITTIYTNFIQGVMRQFSSRLETGMITMMGFWDDAISKIDTTKPTPQVAINFGIAVTTTTPSVDATNVDLTDIEDHITNNGVTWWTRL
ncbi:hypothetical protein DFH09DRAFT_1190811 [Mycena vulgaris]|nr:hypothetical protein DFH09DRAFT_1190811 [Mycena vulgaris]